MVCDACGNNQLDHYKVLMGYRLCAGCLFSLARMSLEGLEGTDQTDKLYQAGRKTKQRQEKRAKVTA